MRRAGLVVGLVILAGCGRDSPEAALLPEGSEAVVVGDSAHYLEDSGDFVLVDPGSRVRIGHDPGVFQETSKDDGPRRYEAPDPMSGFRQVRIVVESGPSRGKAGTLTRNDLRPVR